MPMLLVLAASEMTWTWAILLSKLTNDKVWKKKKPPKKHLIFQKDKRLDCGNLINATQHDEKARTCRRCEFTHKMNCFHPLCCPWCRQAAFAGSIHVGCTVGLQCPLAVVLRRDTREQSRRWDRVTQYNPVNFTEFVYQYIFVCFLYVLNVSHYFKRLHWQFSVQSLADSTLSQQINSTSGILTRFLEYH